MNIIARNIFGAMVGTPNVVGSGETSPFWRCSPNKEHSGIVGGLLFTLPITVWISGIFKSGTQPAVYLLGADKFFTGYGDAICDVVPHFCFQEHQKLCINQGDHFPDNM